MTRAVLPEAMLRGEAAVIDDPIEARSGPLTMKVGDTASTYPVPIEKRDEQSRTRHLVQLAVDMAKLKQQRDEARAIVIETHDLIMALPQKQMCRALDKLEVRITAARIGWQMEAQDEKAKTT